MEQGTSASARLWAVGGGKGGVGKSVISSSLAAAIAGAGRRCVLIDADLGGANLHTLFGVRRPRRTLSDFLTGEVAALEDLFVQTPVPNLFLVSGNRALLEMANPRHGQRERLLRAVRDIDADEVLLDLGAGSAFNVLDFFLLASRRLVVVTPEPTAIENAEHFLRAAFHRSLRDASKRSDVRAAIERVRDAGGSRGVRCARELIERVREIDPPAAKPLEDCAARFRPLLVVNRVETPEHRRLGHALARRSLERLGIALELAGSLDSDPNVPAAIAKGQPVLQAYPVCRFSHRVDALARRLLAGEREGAPRRVGAPTLARKPPPRAAEPELPLLDLAEPGAYLRRCREVRGLDLEEMFERTRIRRLAFIEGERFELLPPEPYLRSHVLSYARELGIREASLLVQAYLERWRDAGR